MKRLLGAAAVAVLVVLLLGCGGSNGSGDDEPGATTTAEPAATEAADAFLALVTPLNTVVGEVNRELQGARSFSEVSGPVTLMREVQRTFREELLRIRFPETVQGQVDDVVAAVEASEGQTDALLDSIDDGTATKADLAAWGSSLQTLAGRAAVLRRALGLPPVD
jgi:hypothetical protein